MGKVGRPLVIVGAGGFGREVLDVVEAINAVRVRWDVVGFLDDGEPHFPDAILRRGIGVVGGVDRLDDIEADYVVGIGSGDVRRRIDERATTAGRDAAILVHSAATIAADVELGPGTVVTAGVRCTSNIRIGRHVHLNLNATVGHDVVIGSYVTVNPGVNISGEVTLGNGVMLGTNAAVLQGRAVGENAVVGAGAVVTTDIAPGVVAVGVPAKPLDR